MIEATVKDDDGNVVASIQLELESVNSTSELGTYNIRLYTDRGEEVLGMRRCKLVYFPIHAINPLGLLLAALKSLPPDVFGVEDDAGSSPAETSVSSDVERRLH